MPRFDAFFFIVWQLLNHLAADYGDMNNLNKKKVIHGFE